LVPSFDETSSSWNLSLGSLHAAILILALIIRYEAPPIVAL